jgi:hypothetical protein
MEDLIHDEVVQFTSHLDKELNQPIQVRNMFNISVINGLWTIIAGKRYNLVSTRVTRSDIISPF